MEVVFGVEIEPLEASTAGMLLGGMHEGVGYVVSPKSRTDVEALDLGSVRDLRQGAKHNASRGRGVGGGGTDVGDPDRGIRAGEVVLKGGAVITDNYADGFVVFLNEGEGGFGRVGDGTVDRDGVGRVQS
jgi:hypothetical protein